MCVGWGATGRGRSRKSKHTASEGTKPRAAANGSRPVRFPNPEKEGGGQLAEKHLVVEKERAGSNPFDWKVGVSLWRSGRPSPAPKQGEAIEGDRDSTLTKRE